MYEVRLKILVWGPGESANPKWWDKRANLIQVLREANPDDDVKTSEELFKELGEPPIEYGHFEIHHAETADLILALVLGSPKYQGGVYRELEIIADSETLRNKTYIFLPSGKGAKAYLQRFQSGSLRAFRETQKYSYDWSTLATCKMVTATSLSLVDEERNQRMYRRRESYRHTLR